MSMNKYPEEKDITFIICEDARTEKSGKWILSGIFTGDIMVERDTKFPATFRRLLFWYLVRNADGLTELKLEVVDPDGKSDIRKLSEVNFRGGHSTILSIDLSPFAAPKPGEYLVNLNLGEKQYQRRFEIELGDKE